MADQDNFWADIALPVNTDYKENDYQIVNPVDVQEKFILAIDYSTRIGEQAEGLAEELADLEREREEIQTKLNRLRRQILADNFSKIKSSWNSELVDAFILGTAGDQLQQLLQYEKEIDLKNTKIGAKKPKLIKAEKRLKLVEKNMEWAKQFLDYEKMVARIKSGNRF